MEEQSQCVVVFETDGGPIDVETLTDFLYHFRSVYAAAAISLPEGGYAQDIDEAKRLAMTLRTDIHGIDWREIAKYAHAGLGDRTLGITDIHRENPLTIVFAGISIALTVAVILSGGRVEFGPIKAELPPLGEGVRNLRAAFGRPPRPGNRPDPRDSGGPSP
ncbi:hypothetical protein [Vreelandella sulfidaeris]